MLACALALERHALQAALRRQGAAVQALRSRFPELRELVESLHECRYADFFKSLAWVCNTIIRVLFNYKVYQFGKGVQGMISY